MLVKDVDGFLAPRRGAKHGRELMRRVARDALSGVVDPYFVRVLDPAAACWVVRGTRPERIARLLETGRTYGTEVIQERQAGRRRADPQRRRRAAQRIS